MISGSEWDKVNIICSGWNKDVGHSWIVQTHDYWVLYGGLTEQAAQQKADEINSMPLDERRTLIRKSRGPIMARASDRFRLLLEGLDDRI